MEKMASISLMDSRDPTHHLMEKSTKLQRRYFLTLPLACEWLIDEQKELLC